MSNWIDRTTHNVACINVDEVLFIIISHQCWLFSMYLVVSCTGPALFQYPQFSISPFLQRASSKNISVLNEINAETTNLNLVRIFWAGWIKKLWKEGIHPVFEVMASLSCSQGCHSYLSFSYRHCQSTRENKNYICFAGFLENVKID